jgi:hypothetical protein
MEESKSGAFMLNVLARLTLSKTKNEVFCLSFISGTSYTGTQQSRPDKMHL